MAYHINFALFDKSRADFGYLSSIELNFIPRIHEKFILNNSDNLPIIHEVIDVHYQQTKDGDVIKVFLNPLGAPSNNVVKLAERLNTE